MAYLENNPNVVTIGIILFNVLIFGFMGWFFRSSVWLPLKRNHEKRKRLLEIGKKAEATIVNTEDTGITINDNPYIRITVEIKPGMRGTFETQVPRINIPRPGDKMVVVYDPANPSEMIDYKE